MSEPQIYAPDYMRSFKDEQLDSCADLMEKYILEKSSKPKRTISLEAYIKMQNDWLIKHETSATMAKETVDTLLRHNGVEVES